jgi:hypothetical protein
MPSDVVEGYKFNRKSVFPTKSNNEEKVKKRVKKTNMAKESNKTDEDQSG